MRTESSEIGPAQEGRASSGGGLSTSDRSFLARVLGRVVGREKEIEVVVAALAADRHVLLEGPPGTGKSTILRAIAQEAELGFEFVEGNAELTPARLVGHFDPARVLADGYDPKIFIDGPLVSALRDGSLLYVEELNRVPEETLNVLITVMSEGELHIPRLGKISAGAGFRLVAAMNPFDAVGTARISAAIYDRTCRLSMGYQSAEDEREIVRTQTSEWPSGWMGKAVELTRATRDHPDVRIGSSVRGAVDLVKVAQSLARLRGLEPTDPGVSLDASLAALSGRIRLQEGCGRTPEEVIRELWERVFGPPDTRGRQSSPPPYPAPGPGSGLDRIVEGADAQKALREQRRQTVSRRELGRHRRFDQVSPELGVLDSSAFDEAMAEDPDEALALLAELTGATDQRLRELARRVAGRIVLDMARTGQSRRRGVGRIRSVPFRGEGGDLDVDASLESLHFARAGRTAPSLDGLWERVWTRPGTALCLAVDRSGSMGGERLATAAVAAAAVAWRAPLDYSVITFADDVLVIKAQDSFRRPEEVVDDLLSVRGHGTTDIAQALRAARAQLSRSKAGRKQVILLSDCRATAGSDPLAAARSVEELFVIVPADDAAEGVVLAAAVGGRCARLAGPSGVPAAFAQLLAA